jgi:drug/metabolite transporter (DMT)-like permease
MQLRSDLYALSAVLLWASLAALGKLLGDVPPFLLTGLGLLVGSVIALPLARFQLREMFVPAKTLALGVYGLFGYHFFLFLAFQTAPAVEANLVNYLWPLGIVLLAPIFFKELKLRIRHVVAGLVGFAGAALAISSTGLTGGGFQIGFLFAFFSAVIWSTYSLGTKKVPHFPTAGIGVFSFVSGVLALFAHVLFETPVSLTAQQIWLIVGLGLGPLGGAFYLWDKALKLGNAQRVGLISFLTPLLSTSLLLIVTGQSLSWQLAVSAFLIIGAAIFGSSERIKK